MRLFGITFLSLEKRRVLLDIAVFGLIGVWLGFALRSHVEVSDLHHATMKADRQKVYSAPLIDDTKRNSSASSAEALQYLNGIEWQWTNISGLFGDGDGVVRCLELSLLSNIVLLDGEISFDETVN